MWKEHQVRRFVIDFTSLLRPTPRRALSSYLQVHRFISKLLVCYFVIQQWSQRSVEQICLPLSAVQYRPSPAKEQNACEVEIRLYS